MTEYRAPDYATWQMIHIYSIYRFTTQQTRNYYSNFSIIISCQTHLHTCPYLFISLLLISCVAIHQQAIGCVSAHLFIEGVHRLVVVAQTGLLWYCTVKSPVLLCLDTQTQANELINMYSHLLVERIKIHSHTCLMAVSPTLSECFRMLSKKSLRSDMEISLISSLSLGRFSSMIWQNL